MSKGNVQQPLYSCAACKLAVIVLDGGAKIRACRCDAPIIANASSALVGKGGVRG